MQHIFNLSKEELYTIAEIVTGYKCDPDWNGLIEKRPKLNPSDSDVVYVAWFVEDLKGDIVHFQIYIEENYDIHIGDVFGGTQYNVKNIVQYVRFIKGIPDWRESADDLNLM